MTFTLTIELGNAAMQDADDVAIALRDVANTVAQHYHPFDGGESGRVKDANGNTVGEWAVV